HRLCLKTLQDIDKKTRTRVALGLIGSFDLNHEIEKRKATFFGQLCRLDPHFAVKRLFLQRLTSHYFFKDIKYGLILDMFRFLGEHNLEHILIEYLNSGVFPSKYIWKKVVQVKLNESDYLSARFEISNEGLERFLNIHPETRPSLFWELSRKYPYMLTACRSVVKLIAVSFNRYQPPSMCSACGELIVNYVNHCLFCCCANSGARQKMWAGIWRKFGAKVYSCLANLSNDSLIDVLFGNFDIIADALTMSQKEEFYCFVARFIHIQKIVCDDARLFTNVS
ncbi:MAG: hypothetical protein AB2693_23515, partial [Candidatus Thiodiazotropha sp.]